MGRATQPAGTHDRAPLADLCDRDPLDLESDPRTCATRPRAPEPCGPLCTPWCLASHPTRSPEPG